MPKRQGGRCLTVVHEYAERISTVLSKDRSTLKSSSSYPVFLSLSFSPIPPKIPFIHPSVSPSSPFSLLILWLEWQINAQVPTEGAFFPFFLSFLFPIIFNSLNLELPWQQEEQGWSGKRAPFPQRWERGTASERWLRYCSVDVG